MLLFMRWGKYIRKIVSSWGIVPFMSMRGQLPTLYVYIYLHEGVYERYADL